MCRNAFNNIHAKGFYSSFSIPKFRSFLSHVLFPLFKLEQNVITQQYITKRAFAGLMIDLMFFNMITMPFIYL